MLGRGKNGRTGRRKEGKRERIWGLIMTLFYDSHPPALMLLDYGDKDLASGKETIPFPVEKMNEEGTF